MEDVSPVLADEPIDEALQHDPAPMADDSAAHELPVMTALAASNVATGPAHESITNLVAAAQGPQQTYNGASPAATSGGGGSGLPTCQNCSTSTTPLWRRDEFGSVLCNACGLFLKLHGRARPISLKTDVIKSRNRVKTMRTDLAPKKKTMPQNNQGSRRKSANGTLEGADSPISRTGTPSMYNQSMPSFMVDDPYNGTGVSGFGPPGDGSGSPMNGDRSLDTPQTHEQLIAHNSSLKTRVSELEVINELFRGRLSQLEQQEAAARRGQEVSSLEQSQLRAQLEASEENQKTLRAQMDDSHRRENSMKRRLDEMELELKQAKDALEGGSDKGAKRPRVHSPAPEPNMTLEESPEEEQQQQQQEHQQEHQQEQQEEADPDTKVDDAPASKSEAVEA